MYLFFFVFVLFFFFFFFFMAPTLKKLEGAYCFWGVPPSVHHTFCVHATVLKFFIWIPHEKIADTYFFLDRILPLS